MAKKTRKPRRVRVTRSATVEREPLDISDKLAAAVVALVVGFAAKRGITLDPLVEDSLVVVFVAVVGYFFKDRVVKGTVVKEEVS